MRREAKTLADSLRLGFGTKLGIYLLLFGIPWVLIGDILVGDAMPPSFSIQTIKGVVFVLICAVFVKIVSDRMNQVLERTEMHRKRVQSMLEQAEILGQVGSWQQNTETGEEVVSAGFINIMGGDEEDRRGIDAQLSMSLHPDDRNRVLAARKSWKEHGGRLEIQYRILEDDGEIRWLTEVAEPNDPDDGFPHVVTGSVLDITQLKAAQLAYEKAQQDSVWRQKLLQIAAEKARFGGWRYEVGNDYEFWSDGAAAVRGLPKGAKVSADEAISYYEPKDQKRISKYFADCLNHGWPFDDVFKLITVDGQKRRVRTIGEAQRDEDGNIVAAQGSIQDVTELFEAREESERQSSELQSVIASIGDGFFTLDREWRCTFINQYALDLLRLDRDTLEGRTFWDVFPEAQGAHFEEQVRDVIAKGESRRFVEYVSAIDKWFEAHAHPTSHGIAIYFSDISEQRAAQRWLELLEEAVAHLNDMVMIGNETPEGPQVVYVNRSFEDGLGFLSEDVRGQAPWFLAGRKTDRAALQRIIDAQRADESSREVICAYRKDGTPTWLELTSTPVIGETEERKHWIAIIRDVNERIRHAERLAESEERFRLISRASSDVIWDWEINSGNFWLSENYEEVFDKNIESEPQTFDASMARIHPDDQHRIRASLIEAIEGDTTSWQAEYRVSTGTGGFKTVEDRAFIIRDAEGKAVRMVAGMTDVTDMRALDQQLHEAQKLESIGQLTGGVAHDFNNLLTIILGNTDMLLERATDETMRQLAEATLDAAERGAELTDSLLAFARRQPLDPVATNVNDLIQASTTLLRKSVDEGISIVCDLAATSAITNVDSNRLQSAILNLVINSGYAIGERGTIRVGTSDAVLNLDSGSHHGDGASGRYICISVTDNGCGMSPEVVEQAFEPFFTTRPLGEGTGLGLSSVYGFVKQSGGHAEINSEPGKGTTVQLFLPVSRDGEALESGKTTSTDLKGRGETILVVEDDENLRANVSTHLEGLGYRVLAAADADEALRYLDATTQVDLLFTDVVMPGGMNGKELKKEAQRRRPGLRVLFTSGYSLDVIARNGKLDEGLRLLSKPYRLAALGNAVKEVLDD